MGPKKDLHTVLDLLYAKGTVHIEDASAPVAPGEITLKKMTGEQAGDISVALSKIGGIFLTLPKIKVDEKASADIYSNLKAKSHEDLLIRANSVINELDEVTKTSAKEKGDLEPRPDQPEQVRKDHRQASAARDKYAQAGRI